MGRWEELYNLDSINHIPKRNNSGFTIINMNLQPAVEKAKRVKRCEGCGDFYNIEDLDPELADKNPYGYYCEKCLAKF